MGGPSFPSFSNERRSQASPCSCVSLPAGILAKIFSGTIAITFTCLGSVWGLIWIFGPAPETQADKHKIQTIAVLLKVSRYKSYTGDIRFESKKDHEPKRI